MEHLQTAGTYIRSPKRARGTRLATKMKSMCAACCSVLQLCRVLCCFVCCMIEIEEKCVSFELMLLIQCATIWLLLQHDGQRPSCFNSWTPNLNSVHLCNNDTQTAATMTLQLAITQLKPLACGILSLSVSLSLCLSLSLSLSVSLCYTHTHPFYNIGREHQKDFS